MTFGQFLDHDLSMTENEHIQFQNDLQRKPIDWLLYDANVIHTSEKISASQSQFLHVYQL